jgi:hypothetical protein
MSRARCALRWSACQAFPPWVGSGGADLQPALTLRTERENFLHWDDVSDEEV